MKRIKFYTKIFLCAGLISVMGCENELDLKPLNELSDAAYWKTAPQFKEAANNFYKFYPTIGDLTVDGPFSDQRADLYYSGSSNNVSNGSYGIPQNDNDNGLNLGYERDYDRIRDVNYLIKKAKVFTDQEAIKTYLAEAYFFRAYTYFDLLMKFGNAVLLEEPLNIDSEELYAKQNSRAETVDFILKDLDYAIANLPPQASVEKGRVSAEAAKAFLARVALFEGTWQKFHHGDGDVAALLTLAVEASKAVMNSGAFELFKPAALGNEAYKYLFILENQKSNPAGITKEANKEYILFARYDSEIRPIGENINHGSFANVYKITAEFADMFLCQNGLPIEGNPQFEGYATMNSEFKNRDNRMANIMMEAGKSYWSYANARVTWDGGPEDLANAAFKSFDPTFSSGYHNHKWSGERAVPAYQEGPDVPVLRYAEVLLTYAEALFERDGAISDEDLDISLNLVRQRVNKDMPKLSNALVNTNGLSMREEIRRERTIELFLEGHRFNDLRRWKTAEDELPEELVGVKITGTEFETEWSNPPALNADGRVLLEPAGLRTFDPSKNYLYPIPRKHTDMNPNLIQTDGWVK